MNEILNRTKDHFESLQDEASSRLPSSSLTKEEEKNILTESPPEAKSELVPTGEGAPVPAATEEQNILPSITNNPDASLSPSPQPPPPLPPPPQSNPDPTPNPAADPTADPTVDPTADPTALGAPAPAPGAPADPTLATAADPTALGAPAPAPGAPAPGAPAPGAPAPPPPPPPADLINRDLLNRRGDQYMLSRINHASPGDNPIYSFQFFTAPRNSPVSMFSNIGTDAWSTLNRIV